MTNSDVVGDNEIDQEAADQARNTKRIAEAFTALSCRRGTGRDCRHLEVKSSRAGRVDSRIISKIARGWAQQLLGGRRAADLVVFQDTRRTVELEGGGLLAGCGAAQRKKKAAKGRPLS